MKHLTLKSFSTSCAFIFLSAMTFGQEPLCTWGESMENDKPDNKLSSFLGADESGFYVKRESGPVSDHYIWIEKYNNAFKKLYTKNITPAPGTFNDAQYYRSLIFGDGKFMVFAQTWKKTDAKSAFNVREVNLEGEVSEKIVELDNMPAEKQGKMGDYYVKLSNDKSKLLVLSQPGFDKGTMEKIKLKVFDAKTWKELWSKEIDFAVEAVRYPKNDIAIDNNGDAYLYKETKLDKGVFKRTLYTYNSSTSKLEEKNIDLGSNYAPHSDLRFNSKGDLILSGFYTHQNNMEMEGTFYFRIDSKTKAIAAQKTEPLAKDLLENLMSAKEASKPNASIDNFKFLDILSRSDGSMLMIAEYITTDKSAVTGTGGAGVPPSYDYTYNSKDVVLICIGNDGNKLWNTVYKKTQSENTRREDRKFDSFVYGLFNDKFVIIWNNIDLNRSMIPAVMGVPAWKEADEVVHKKSVEFGTKALYAPFMEIIESNGEHKFKDLKFGLPLKKMHESSPFEMGLNSTIFLKTEDGLILYSEMADGKRVKFGKIKL